MRSKPLLSLCCSTYSRPDLFQESLKGLLRQTYEPLEIVVLVDGGNPSTLAVLEAHQDPRLRWFVTLRPSGMIAAWNKVVSESRGEYFLYCADDDVLLESAVERQIELLEQHPQVGFCHADFYLIDDEGKRIGQWNSHEGSWIKDGLSEWERYLRQPRCCMQTTIVRRELWERVGRWDESAGYPGDNSLYLRLLRISDVGHVERFVCNYRIRTKTPDSWLKNSKKVMEDVALARQHLADPPLTLLDQVPRLLKKVNNHFSINAISVLADKRASTEEREVFTRWVNETLLEKGALGVFYRWVIKHRLELALGASKSLEFRLRALARKFAATAKKWTTLGLKK